MTYTLTILSDKKMVLSSRDHISSERALEIRHTIEEWGDRGGAVLVMSDTEVIDLRDAHLSFESSPAEVRHERLLLDQRHDVDVRLGTTPPPPPEPRCARVHERFALPCGLTFENHQRWGVDHTFYLPAPVPPSGRVVESHPDVLRAASEGLRDTVTRRVMRRGRRW